MIDNINQDLIAALKNKDQLRSLVLRHLKTALSNDAIALKKKDQGLSVEESLKAIKREAKKRQDAIEAYQSAGRTELAEQESRELAIIEEYLPKQLSAAKIAEIVDSVMVEIKPAGPQDFGRVMSAAMKKVGQQADGTVVKQIVQAKLNK